MEKTAVQGVPEYEYNMLGATDIQYFNTLLLSCRNNERSWGEVVKFGT